MRSARDLPAGRAFHAGEFTLLQARYVTDRHHVDVTDRLRDFAGRDRRGRR